MRVRHLMPALECENDMGGRFTKRPFGNGVPPRYKERPGYWEH